MAQRNLSPRLASLVADQDDIRDAVLQANILTTHDLGTLAADADIAATRLKLEGPHHAAFVDIFTIAKSKMGSDDEGRMQTQVDVLNSEGQLIMMRPRSVVHRQGFWHRVVNVWVVCTTTRQVLLGQRSVGKDHDPRRWTCVCGRVPSGEISHRAAMDKLADELSIRELPVDKLSLMFSIKVQKPMTQGLFAGQQDNAWIDVYVACLEQEIPVHKILLNVQAKQAAKYVPLAELQRAFDAKNSSYVLPPSAEYSRKLMHYLTKICEGSVLSRAALPENTLRPGLSQS